MTNRLGLLVFIIVGCSLFEGRPTASEAVLQILPNKEEIVVQAGDDVTITCIGDQYLSWEYSTHAYSYPDQLRHDIDNRLQIDSYSNDGTDYPSEYTHVSTVRILNATYLDTGYVTCLNEDDEVSRIYVYVRDPKHLWSIVPTPSSSRLLGATVGGRVIIPCRPTDPAVAVLLKESSVQVYPSRRHKWVAYNPREGFIISSYNFDHDTEFECIAQLPRLGKTESFTFHVKVDHKKRKVANKQTPPRASAEEITFISQEPIALPEDSFGDMLPIFTSELLAAESTIEQRQHDLHQTDHQHEYQQDSSLTAEAGVIPHPSIRVLDQQGPYLSDDVNAGLHHSWSSPHPVDSDATVPPNVPPAPEYVDYTLPESESATLYDEITSEATIQSGAVQPARHEVADDMAHVVSDQPQQTGGLPEETTVESSTAEEKTEATDAITDPTYEFTVTTVTEAVVTEAFFDKTTQSDTVAETTTEAISGGIDRGDQDYEYDDYDYQNNGPLQLPFTTTVLPTTSLIVTPSEEIISELEDMIIPDDQVDDFLKFTIATTTIRIPTTTVDPNPIRVTPASTSDGNGEADEPVIDKKYAFTVGPEPQLSTDVTVEATPSEELLQHSDTALRLNEEQIAGSRAPYPEPPGLILPQSTRPPSVPSTTESLRTTVPVTSRVSTNSDEIKATRGCANAQTQSSGRRYGCNNGAQYTNGQPATRASYSQPLSRSQNGQTGASNGRASNGHSHQQPHTNGQVGCQKCSNGNSGVPSSIRLPNEPLNLQTKVTILNDKPTKLGGTIELECHMTVPEDVDAMITWSLPQNIERQRQQTTPLNVYPEGSGMKTLKIGLTILNVRRGDEGPYVCLPSIASQNTRPAQLVGPTATNGYSNGRNGHSASKTNGHYGNGNGIQIVQGPRPIIEDKTKGRPSVGGSFILECSAQNTRPDTTLELVWKIPYAVEKSGRSQIVNQPNRVGRAVSTMTVSNLQLSDKGSYTCVAEEIHNETGSLMSESGGGSVQLR